MGKYTYLLIDLLCLIIPLLFSFHPKIKLYKKWKYLIPSIIIVYIIMFAWDYLFTLSGIWSFNKNYICGVYFFSVPLEEHLFLCYMPFLFVFIYECMNIFFQKDFIGKNSLYISFSLIIILPFSISFFNEKTYTSVVSLCVEFLLVSILLFTKSHYTFLGKFYQTFAVFLVPLFIVSALLVNIPIVLYNNEYNLSIFVFNIPVENILYNLFLMLSVTFIYELLQKKYSAAIILPSENEL